MGQARKQSFSRVHKGNIFFIIPFILFRVISLLFFSVYIIDEDKQEAYLLGNN